MVKILTKNKPYFITLFVLFAIFAAITVVSIFIKSLGIISLAMFSLILIFVLYSVSIYLLDKIYDVYEKKEIILYTSITSIVCLIIYLLVVYNRDFVYFDDHIVYYNQQFELERLFNEFSIKGLYAFIASVWFSDYSFFINVFLEAPFIFTSKSNDSYVITYYLTMIVPVFFSANMLIVKLGKELKIRKTFYYLLCNFLLITFPLLHFASMLGMPDIFGLYFVFLIMIILIDYDFKKYDFKTISLTSFLVIGLIICRRWYLFWAIGYVFSIYFVKILDLFISTSFKIDKEIVKNYIKSVITMAIYPLVLLAPFIYKTLFLRNYSDEYSYWYLGGFPYECYNQLGYLGILFFVVLCVGFVYGLINKKTRLISSISALGIIITMFSFTRIQNMGKHQSLCLIGYYLTLAFIAFLGTMKIKNKYIRYTIIFMLIAIMVMNVLSTYLVFYDNLDGVFLTTKYAIASRFNWK